VSQCVEGLGVAGCSRLATSRQKSSETSRLSVAEGMARRMPSWSLPWHCLRAPAAVFRGRGSRCFVAVPLPAVGSLVQIGKDVIEADGAIRSLRADAALLDAAANSEHLALRPQERALAALFSADARETAAAWQGWVSGGPTARAIKTSDQRDPPAREDSSWLGLVGSAVSTAAETVQTVGATSVGTLGVAATAASKDLVGMETFAKELARQQLTLAWLGSMLSAHAAAGTGSGEELQEALVSRAKASGILKIHVVAEVLPPGQPQGLLPREERYVSVAWDTAWPSERVGSW
jgi:hypothetical protein